MPARRGLELRSHCPESRNLQTHAHRLEHLQEKWLSACEARVSFLGEQLQEVETELAKRDISAIPTNQLFYLAESLGRQIKREIGPMTTSPVSDIPGNEYVSQVQDWTP